MKYLLGYFSDSWADEMEVSGLFICPAPVWKNIEDDAKEYFVNNHTLTYYVGTNEEIEYENFDDWRRRFTFTELEGHRAAVLLAILRSLTGKGYSEYPLSWSFGHDGIVDFREKLT